jgi:hypothetical protein
MEMDNIFLHFFILKINKKDFKKVENNIVYFILYYIISYIIYNIEGCQDL